MRAEIVPTIVAIVAGFAALAFGAVAWWLSEKLHESRAARRVTEETLAKVTKVAEQAVERADRHWDEVVSMQKRAGLFLGDPPPVTAQGVPIIPGGPVVTDAELDQLVEELNGAWYWDL